MPSITVAQIHNRWRARRVLKGLMLCHDIRSEGWRYYESIFNATFFIA